MRIVNVGFLSGSLVIAAVLTLAAGDRATAPAIGLPLGTAAPDFFLQNREGQSVRLSDFRGQKSVALVFYPAQFRAGS